MKKVFSTVFVLFFVLFATFFSGCGESCPQCNEEVGLSDNDKSGENGDSDVTDGVDGKDGEKGDSCTVTDNGDGTKTIKCDDGTEVTINDGTDGKDLTATISDEDPGDNCKYGGKKITICQDSGAGECVDGTVEEFFVCNGAPGESSGEEKCVLDDVRHVECETNPLKKQKQTCSEHGWWKNEGECILCYEGEMRWSACSTDSGKKQKQVCNSSEAWVNDGVCITCYEGEVSWEVCEEEEEERWQKRICNSSEVWEKVGECIDIDGCNVGTVLYPVCEDNPAKRQKRVCNEDRVWEDVGECVDNCSPSAQRNVVCNANYEKIEKEICDSDRNWIGTGICFDNCAADSERLVKCGDDKNKMRKQKCGPDLNWADYPTCYDIVSSTLCTGQMFCHSLNAISPCPEVNEEFYGQDIQYAESGFCVPDDYTVKEYVVVDNNTGLIWQKFIPSVYDGCTGGSRCSWSHAVSYCENLELDGFEDWRLPNDAELHTLINYGNINAAINRAVFPVTPNNYFWTSAVYEDDETRSWYVSFINGEVSHALKTSTYPVRCVRGAALSVSGPFTEATVSGKVVVTDNKTKLKWTKERFDSKNWKNALDQCETLSYGGYSDWRLPNINELATILDRSQYMPASDFPGIDHLGLWSSTPSRSSSNSAWILGPGAGIINSVAKSGTFSAICVRN